MEDHAWHLEHGAKVDAIEVGGRRFSRSEYAAALRRFALIARTATSDGDFARQVSRAFELREIHGDKPFLVTSYYEPIVPGSRSATGAHSQPLYRAPPEIKKGVPFLTRAQIDREHALAGRGLEICWVDPIVAFVLQTEGGGTVELDDGTRLQLDHGGTNEQPHVAIGRLLVDRIPREQMSMHAIERYLRTLPENEMRTILEKNPRYAFFKPRPHPGAGPATSIGIPAVAGRSVAIDPRLVPMGTLLMLKSDKPRFKETGDHLPAGWERFSRVVLAHDTGGGIKGARIDLYWGEGREAERNAGVMKQPGRLYHLIPR